MKHEYHEGPEARENFKRGMRALFKVRKSAVTTKRQPEKATARKTSGKNKG